MKRTVKKLHLSKETVAALGNSHLHQVAGGVDPFTKPPFATYTTCPEDSYGTQCFTCIPP